MDDLLQELGKVYARFCRIHKLQYLSADELLHELLNKQPERKDLHEWLSAFIELWDKTADML